MSQERYFSRNVCWRVRRTRREGLPVAERVVEVEERVVEVDELVEVVDEADSSGAEGDAVIGVTCEVSAASAPVVAAGRVVEVVPRAGRRDFLANSGISVGVAENGGR